MKKKYSYILNIILLLLLSSNQLFPQNDLNEKYWFYKGRLKSDFMLGIGGFDFGLSLPANERIITGENSAKLKWSDVTLHMGAYITILSTEYALLTMNGENTEETLYELFNAIETLNRLDYYAEHNFMDANGNLGTDELNGFFIRDDVGSINHYERLNTNPNIRPVNSFESDFIDQEIYLKEESKDQIIYLLYGLLSVTIWIPEDITSNLGGYPLQFKDGETFLNQEAKNIADRLVNYMHDSGDAGWSWIIKNPVTDEHVLRGWDGYTLSWGFAKALNAISQYNVGGGSTQDGPAALALWDSYAGIYIPNDEDIKVITLAAIGNGWGELTFSDVLGRAFNFSPWNYEWVPLLFPLKYYDFDFPTTNYFGYYKNLLDQAPCYGTYNYGNGNYENFEWSSRSRYMWPGSRGDLDPGLLLGDYSGLGYLLYYNLFCLAYRDILPPYENLSSSVTSKYNSIVWKDYPYLDLYGTSSNPKYENAFISITANNTISENGNVTYKAGETINLTDGFEAREGSTFRAFIEPNIENHYSCGSINNFKSTGIALNQKSRKNNHAIENSLNRNVINVFPNPCFQHCTVTSSFYIASIELYDSKSNKIFEESGLHNKTKFINLAKFPKGLYFARVITEKSATILKIFKK
jgi:hypothetical protein